MLALSLEEHYRKKGKENIKYGLNKPLPNLANPIIEQDILKSDILCFSASATRNGTDACLHWSLKMHLGIRLYKINEKPADSL